MRRKSTLGSPLRENRTAGFAWGFGHKREISRPNSTSHKVNQDRLIGRLGKVIEDTRILKLVGMTLRSGVMKDGVVTPTMEGTTQGSPLSPLLSNLVLDELDKEIESRGLEFCRFADDCNIFVKTQLKLVVNGGKEQGGGEFAGKVSWHDDSERHASDCAQINTPCHGQSERTDTERDKRDIGRYH